MTRGSNYLTAAADFGRLRLGRRGACLLVFAFIDFVIGWSLFDAQGQAQVQVIPAYRVILAMLPIFAWACLWVTAGAACAVSAFLRMDRIGFALAIAVKAAWAGGLLLAWWPLHVPRAWLAGATWLVLAALVLVISGWPEAPRKVAAGRDQ